MRQCVFERECLRVRVREREKKAGKQREDIEKDSVSVDTIGLQYTNKTSTITMESVHLPWLRIHQYQHRQNQYPDPRSLPLS